MIFQTDGMAGRARSALALAVLVLFAWAQAAPGQPSREPLGSSILDLGSEVYRAETFTLPGPGSDYRVAVLRPDRPAPPGGFPAVYLLDGQAVLEALTEALLAGLPPGRRPVIVTLGYDTDRRFPGDRTRDYTPPAPDGAAATDPRGNPAGGAPAFLDLLREEIVPRAERLAPVDPGARVLWGHSYGGLFALYAAGRAEAPFTTYAAASPSVWWDYGTFLTGLEAKMAQGGWPRRRLILYQGGAEREGLQRADPESERTRERMAAALPGDPLGGLAGAARAAGVPVSLTIFPGLRHGGTFRASLIDILGATASQQGIARPPH